MNHRWILVLILIPVSASSSSAQSSAFTYQGKLSTSGVPANGAYDMQFKLFDALATGNQVGATLTFDGSGMNPPTVSVTNGIFTVTLDFGACGTCFNGEMRFLEIAVRPTGVGSYTSLSPRQSIASTPYAIKTQNLTFNGSFNDGGTMFTASNTFAGEGAGLNTTPNPSVTNSVGKLNSFFGAGAGEGNTTGFENAFFGTEAGQANTTGAYNSYFGRAAGQRSNGFGNAFFGYWAGVENTSGGGNAFFGYRAGTANTAGGINTFIGINAGAENTVGGSNTFVGHSAGGSNTVGGSNTFIGFGANFGSFDPTGNYNTLLGTLARVDSGLNNATAIGARAQTTQSNSLVLGSINGINGADADTNVGIGTSAPAARLDVVGNGLFSGNLGIGTTAPSFKLEIVNSGSAGLRVQSNTAGGQVASFGSNGDFSIDAPFISAGRFVVKENGNVGIGVFTPLDLLDVSGVVRLRSLASGNTTTLCRNSSNQISNCSSSIRYKSHVATLSGSLNLIHQLRPVTFDWKQGGAHDMGLIAEEVEKVAPLLTFRNERGEIEGVKYDRVAVVLLNAVKEQQTQIGNQQRLIEQQQQHLERLRRLVCSTHRRAKACK